MSCWCPFSLLLPYHVLLRLVVNVGHGSGAARGSGSSRGGGFRRICCFVLGQAGPLGRRLSGRFVGSDAGQRHVRALAALVKGRPLHVALILLVVVGLRREGGGD